MILYPEIGVWVRIWTQNLGNDSLYSAEFSNLSMSVSESGGLKSAKPVVVEAGLLGSESDLLYNAVMTILSFPSGEIWNRENININPLACYLILSTYVKWIQLF